MAFVWDSTDIPANGRGEYATTKAVRMRLPDRDLSDGYRDISDLRRINLGIYNDDFSPIRLPDVKDITEIIATEKRQ